VRAFGISAACESLAQAAATASRHAVELDPESAEAHASRAIEKCKHVLLPLSDIGVQEIVPVIRGFTDRG
jgi:hypothetical protein